MSDAVDRPDARSDDELVGSLIASLTARYGESGVTVRDDLVEAHARVMAAWARPGNHWSGTDRLAIVEQSRVAVAAAVEREAAGEELPPWYAPSSDADRWAALATDLPAVAVDAIWRLTNHSGTLTEGWYHSIAERGLDAERYVELVGVVATARSIDTFAVAMGIDPVPLPDPVAGEPDGDRPADAVVSTHWVPTVPSGGPNVRKALTLVPVAARDWSVLGSAQYLDGAAMRELDWSRGALDRMQVELLAARTSLLNECFY